MLGHVTDWGLGGHVMQVSQGRVVRDAPSVLGYSWTLGPGLGDLVISSETRLGFGSSRASLATGVGGACHCLLLVMVVVTANLYRYW
jgi:hypothetical protein